MGWKKRRIGQEGVPTVSVNFVFNNMDRKGVLEFFFGPKILGLGNTIGKFLLGGYTPRDVTFDPERIFEMRFDRNSRHNVRNKFVTHIYL